MKFTTAKEMYIYFLGSSFYMDREGVYQQYQSFNPTSEDELAWRQELIETLVAKLPDTEVLYELKQLEAHEALPLLATRLKSGDGFLRCRIAETIWDIVHTLRIRNPGNNFYETEKAAAEETFRYLVEKPEQETSFIMQSTNEVIDSAYVIERAKNNLERIAYLRQS